MLDELCTVARDLLILRTASKDAGLLSGVCTQKELKELLPMFTTEELLRMTSLLRDAAAGFSTSANRRIDAELCLLRLCKPEAMADTQSILARISRMEEKLAAGVVVRQSDAPAPEADSEAPPWDDDDLPPLPEEPPMEAAPVSDGSFWAGLVERLRTALKPPAVGMFANSDLSPVKGVLRGDELTLTMRDDMTKRFVDKPNVLQTVAECASAVAGRKIRVSVARPGEQRQNNGGLDRLLSFGEQHPDIVEFK